MGFKKCFFNIWAVRACPRKRGSGVGLSALAFLFALRLRSVTNKKSSNNASIPHASNILNLEFTHRFYKDPA